MRLQSNCRLDMKSIMSNQSDRRKGSERRDKKSRRRHADARTLSIELCHSVLRIVLVIDDPKSDKPILRAESIRWRKNAEGYKSEESFQELADTLKEYVNTNRLAGCRVSFALSSTLCVNRASSGPVTTVEKEISELQERSQMYLALGPGDKTTAVGRKLIDARHSHALVTVASRDTLDMLVRAAESAGLVVDIVESALVALSRFHGVTNPQESAPVILAQLDEQKFELGVSRKGQLLHEYRPSAETTLSDLGKTITNHYSRFQRYCQRQYGVGHMDIQQLLLVGEPSEIKETNTDIDHDLQVGIINLDSINTIWNVETPEKISEELGAAMGLALYGDSQGVGVSPNLMDQIFEEKVEPIRPFLMKAGTIMAATILLAASLWAYNLEQRYEIAAIQKEVDLQKPQELRGKQLFKQVSDNSVEIDNLVALDKRTPGEAVGPLLNALSKSMPNDVWLKRLFITDLNRAKVYGISYTEPGVYDYVSHLQQIPGFEEVALLGTAVDQTPSGPATGFELDITLAPQASREVVNHE